MPELYQLTPPYLPYCCLEAVQYLESLLTPSSVVFEFGSGASTIWLAKRVASITSIEHHAGWHNQVTQLLKEQRLRAIVKLVEPEKIPSQILEYKDDYFDLVFVDCFDIYRNDCVKIAMNKIKVGGFLVLDDSHWGKLRSSILALKKWNKTDKAGLRYHYGAKKIITAKTSFFQKPTDENRNS